MCLYMCVIYMLLTLISDTEKKEGDSPKSTHPELPVVVYDLRVASPGGKLEALVLDYLHHRKSFTTSFSSVRRSLLAGKARKSGSCWNNRRTLPFERVPRTIYGLDSSKDSLCNCCQHRKSS